MDEFLKKVDQVSMVDTSKLNTFLLKEKALEFTKIKSENPKFSQSEICKMMGTSDSTMRRVRNDLGISSPFRHTVKLKKKKKVVEKAPEKPQGRVQEKDSFYCTDCSKVFKSSKASKNHTCNKDALGGGGGAVPFQLFGRRIGETDEEICKRQFNEILGEK